MGETSNLQPNTMRLLMQLKIVIQVHIRVG